MKQRLLTSGFVLIGLFTLTGCDTLSYYYNQVMPARESTVLAFSPVQVDEKPRLITATGYAPISLQPGQTQDQKVLMAMRASKLQAYQELAAIVHGQQLFGTSQVRDMVLQNDQFNAAVGGVIRGARVVKAYPVQQDTYATILEIDLREVQRAYMDIQ